MTFNIDMMCTRVSCYDACVVISQFILVLMLCISFVVAVPVNQLRASPRKGSKFFLQQMHVCGWLDCNSFIADTMLVLPELYMSLMFESSTCVDSRLVGADDGLSRDQSSCCVLASCLLKVFQWHSWLPRETCAVMIQECCVGYACRTGWKMTDSPNSVLDEFVVGVSINIML